MPAGIQTFLGNVEPGDGTGSVDVAAGTVFLGGHIQMTEAEQIELKQENRLLLPGPAVSPGAPALGALAVANGAAGLLSAGAYKWVVTFLTSIGETLASAEFTFTMEASKKGVLSGVPVAPIGVGSAVSGVTARKIYRTKVAGTTGTEKLVGEIADNVTTTFEDNIADGSLGASIPATDTSSNAVVALAAIRNFRWHQGT